MANPLNAVFHVIGSKEVSGKLKLRVFDFYRKVLFEKEYNFTGGDAIKLPLNANKLGTGLFFVRAEFIPEGGKPYYDFYRFSVMRFLQNKHASKNLFSSITFVGRLSRSKDLARNMMNWGFGSISWGDPENKNKIQLLDKYGITVLGYALFYPYSNCNIKGVSKGRTRLYAPNGI